MLFAAGALGGCGTVRGVFGGGGKGTGESGPRYVAEAVDYEALLLAEVKAHLKGVAGAESRNRLVRRKPYYFKEYAEYAAGARPGDITMVETASRTAPYRADVTLRKVRYATRLRRAKDAARLDTDFLRDTGTEVLSYEFNSGQWRRLGSLFVAEKTEERVGGAWVPVREEPARLVPEEEAPRGWFGRLRKRLPFGG